MKLILRERQWFRQWWLVGLLLAFFIYWAFALFKVYHLKETFANMEPHTFHAFFTLIPALILLLSFSRLDTLISTEGLYYRFLPFQFKMNYIPWKEVEHVYLRKWSLWEFWGWGIRYNFKMTAYTTMGFNGIQVNLKNGKKYLFGTQKPEEVAEALKMILLNGKPGLQKTQD